MKRTLQILATLAVILTIITIGCVQTKESGTSYVPRKGFSESPALWAGAAEDRRRRLADPETGEINYDLMYRVKSALAKMQGNDASRDLDLGWNSAGPDNIGGRTRAICTYAEDPSKIIIGSVTGGLFRSNDSGVNWSAIESFDSNTAVSAIARTGDGRIYVGTGHHYEDFRGDGLFVSEDDGNTWNIVQNFKPSITFQISSWSEISDLQADPVNPNKVWIAYRGGIATYTWGDADIEAKLGAGYGSALDISNDGQTIIVTKSFSVSITTIHNRVYVSTDGGASFQERSGSAFGQIPNTTGRVEVTLSHENPDYMYALLSNPSGYLRGVYASTNRGALWYEIAPDSQNGTSPFSPFSVADQGQGNYDNTCIVVPGHPDQLIIGGIRMYKFQLASPMPPLAGTWSNLNINFANGNNPYYVHSDIHTLHWDANGVFYIGCDGGIFKSFDQATTFVSANYNYRSTQFYGISCNTRGHVAGGTQDNGTLLVTGEFSTPTDGNSINGGDGFDTEMSQFDRDMIFSTIYNNAVFRSLDAGEVNSDIFDPTFVPGSFYTRIALFEKIDEDMATEAYTYVADQDYLWGETINYSSLSYGIPLSHVFNTADTLHAGDTLMLPDPAQSLFAVGGFGEFALTRQATQAEISGGEMEYALINLPGNSSVVTCFAFSPDGDKIYVGTSNGSIFRISGMRTAYTVDELESTAASTITAIRQAGGNITKISVDPNNPNRLVYSAGSYTNSPKVYLTTEAETTTSAGSFVDIWNIEEDLSYMPVHSILFDKMNPDRILAGTEYGIWVSDDLGQSWEEANAGMGRVPVYSLRQQILTNADLAGLMNGSVVYNEGSIYVGTFGKGIYYNGEFILSVDDIQSNLSDKPFFDLKIYPNPTADIARVSLNLTRNANVTLEVMDMSGRLVYRDLVGRVASGERVMTIPVNRFENGNYILNVITDNYNETGRFVVLK